MSTLASLKPTTPIQPTDWLLPGVIPAGELVLLDGLPGVGKSLLSAALASIIATTDNTILYLSSPRQHEPMIEFLANQSPNYDRIQGLVYEPDSQAIANNTTLAFHLFETIQDALREHHPRLFIIDSLEELLEPAGDTDGKTLHELWNKLRALARLHHCTLLVPRKNGLHENRQYGPFTKMGTEAAAFALTLAWHPTDPTMRVLTVAKHQRGRVGEQTHAHIKYDGKMVLTYTDPHHHVRPAKHVATWQPDPPNAQEDDDIIKFVEGLLQGMPQPKSEILNYVTKTGFTKTAFKRAMSRAKLKYVRDGVEWFYIPTPQMDFRNDLKHQQQNQPDPSQDSALSTQDLKNSPENLTREQSAAPNQPLHHPSKLTRLNTPMTARQAG